MRKFLIVLAIILLFIIIYISFNRSSIFRPLYLKNNQICIDNSMDIQKTMVILNEKGGTLFLKNGVYQLDETLNINKSNISITGEPGTIIKLNNHKNKPVIVIGNMDFEPSNIIKNISINTIIIDGNKSHQDFEDDTSKIFEDKYWLKNNGISVRQVENLNIANVNICNARSGGLIISKNSKYVYVNNCKFYDNFYDGIGIYESSEIYISNFQSFNNGYAGLSIDDKTTNSYFNFGNIYKNGDVGLFIRDASYLFFFNLIVNDNQSHGLFFSHKQYESNSGVKNIFLINNVICYNKGNGFWMASEASKSENITLNGCILIDNLIAPIKDDYEILDIIN